MPPKTRGNKIMRASKENIGVSNKTKPKTINNVTKLPRKALADKTNSASDDNVPSFQSKPGVNVIGNEDNLLNKQRPRRNRRLPSRYIEINGIQNLSNSKNTSAQKDSVSKTSPVKNVSIVAFSPLKTPKLVLDSSLTARRPKRICRLPSKFNDHSISPSKFVPVQPAYASTPKIVNKPVKEVEKNDSNNQRKLKKTSDMVISKKLNKKKIDKKILNTSKTISPNSSADTNNNAKTDQIPHRKTKNRQNTSPKSSIPNPKSVTSKKLVNKNFSIRILEDKKKSLKRDASNFDVYEFTYDPNDEPPPQKKKRRKPIKKRERKPKSVVFKDNYDRNLAKTLRTLKNTISDKTSKPVVKSNDNMQTVATQITTAHPVPEILVTTINSPIPTKPCNSNKCYTSMKNYNSVRVEDIELDFDLDDCANDVNYSPVHSPCHETAPSIHNNKAPDNHLPTNDPLSTPANRNDIPVPAKTTSKNDPLNLRDELSFFDDPPVASSSMNVSTRNPAASPWRVEFGSLPIKWQVNTYVKPNMTPAFESSFMNFNDSKKKHVYTNIVPETNEENDLPQIYEDYSSKLKQTSIISFIKEVVERNAKKKKEKMTPTKANSLFKDVNVASVNKGAVLAQNDHVTPKKIAPVNVQVTDQGTPPQNVHISDENADVPDNPIENEKDSSKESSKNSNKKGDRNVTYFGFDDSEDQENVSPVKKFDKRKLRALKPRSRAVLQEINKQKGPTRAVLPVAVKSKSVQSSEAANKLFDQMKSATEPPVFPDENPVQNTETTNITEVQSNMESNDDESVHLFEDIEVVHNIKAHRKSYGKAKKTVAFRQNSISDSDVPHSDVAEESASSDDDDMHDLTFKIPAMEPKKPTRKKKPKKPKISKKQEQEVEAWAAGFNSMCEDIEEFDLVVE